MIFVIDASSLIAFFSEKELDEPELLHSLADNNNRLIIPKAVFDELEKAKDTHKHTYLSLSKAIEENKISVSAEVSPEETESFRRRHPRLSNGEVQVLLLGLRMKADSVTGYFCVIDEGPGRTIAQRNSICLMGTRGLINLLCKMRIIDDRKKENLLYKLDHCNFRS